ncbi:hypothetical protein FHW77_002863 [Agrobacterium sp. RC10-4-1]|uniref:hypothetical protein n=1 Tax=Agrobacterium sp. RC10-4-1 TaxID=2587039 RepID=UPI0015FBD304|nr:hypothetical protein [Agrobacterium sp. RC10-4-1]MBA8799144.1 hypothetical protein [Agrobacterium sp. RC10-4-1]
MELLDRNFQREILQGLSEVYPRSADIRDFYQGRDERQVKYNLYYLCEHGLATAKWQTFMDGEIHVINPQITAKGIDFITDDGGLSAILGVVTVKLHEETIKALLIQKVRDSAADETVKASLIAKIKAAPAEVLGKLAERALDSGLDQLPDLAESLSKWLGL